MATLNPLPLGIVADDITGAGDIGALLAAQGYAARIVAAEADWEALVPRLLAQRTDALILDTDSRLIDPQEAAGRVRRATRLLREGGCRTFWKKTCSVFRGNVGAEFDALLDELGEPFAVALAAFPKNGRTTLHGQHFVRGVPLPQTEFAHDPVHPRTDADLLRDLGRQTEYPVAGLPIELVRGDPERLRAEIARQQASGLRYLLADTETQADLKALAAALAGERVYLGSSALAEELPGVWPPVPPFTPLSGAALPHPRRVLLLAGSVMPQTQAQVAAFRAAGGREFVLDPETALTNPEEAAAELAEQAARVLKTDQPALIRTPNTPEQVQAVRMRGMALGLDGTQVSTRLSTVLAQAAAQAARAADTARLIALGGDTSAALTRALWVRHTLVVRELEPGLPITYAPDERLLLVLKSGSFGTSGFLQGALEALGEM